jgi:hypothetical protein
MFRPFSALRSWWRRRRFQHLVEAESRDSHDECQKARLDIEIESEMLAETSDDRKVSPKPLVTPLALYFNAQPPKPHRSYPFQRSKTFDSFQDSIESMDSVMDSHWDPDDEENSHANERHRNPGDAYLLEHLNFLSVSTLPQEVELVHGS